VIQLVHLDLGPLTARLVPVVHSDRLVPNFQLLPLVLAHPEDPVALTVLLIPVDQQNLEVRRVPVGR